MAISEEERLAQCFVASLSLVDDRGLSFSRPPTAEELAAEPSSMEVLVENLCCGIDVVPMAFYFRFAGSGNRYSISTLDGKWVSFSSGRPILTKVASDCWHFELVNIDDLSALTLDALLDDEPEIYLRASDGTYLQVKDDTDPAQIKATRTDVGAAVRIRLSILHRGIEGRIDELQRPVTDAARISQSFYAVVRTKNGRLLNFTYPVYTSTIVGTGGNVKGVMVPGSTYDASGAYSENTEYLIATDRYDDESRLYFRYMREEGDEASFTIQALNGGHVTISNRGYLYQTDRSDWARAFIIYDAETNKRLTLDLMLKRGGVHKVHFRESRTLGRVDCYQWNVVSGCSWSYVCTDWAKCDPGEFSIEIVEHGVKGYID